VPYLIDGNNLLGSWGREAARKGRAQVVQRVAAFCRERGARAILVFDGAPLRADVEDQQLGSLSLRFPAPGQDADSLIRQIVDASARPAELIVVSSDKALYSYARTRGASVLRAHEWNRLAAQPTARPARTAALPAEAAEKPQREDDVEGWLERFERRQPVDSRVKKR